MNKDASTPEGTDLVKDYMLRNVKVKVRLTKNEKIIANAEMDFCAFKVKNFTIRQKDDGTLWVNPPSQPMKPPAKWIRLFWSEDTEFWSKLAAIVIIEYKNKVKEKSSFDEEGITISPENIPF